MTTVTPEDVEALVELFDAGDWDELRITLDDFELHLNKDPKARRTMGSSAQAPSQPETQVHGPSKPETTKAPASAPEAPGEFLAPEGMTVLKAPNLGIFYRSPKPGAPAYVEVGQKVGADTDMCLIEVMKLFTPVKAGVAGTVHEILVADAELVEFDQPLFVIEPDA